MGNVELVLEGTIFWQVVNVPKMIQTTGDPKGDVWFHARSAMIQAVSQVSLEVFMAEFSEIVDKASKADDAFYSERGVRMHALEVTHYACADATTSAVLQDIIQETTNRINRMQKQQSDNEVQRERVAGEIEVENQRTELVKAQCDNDLCAPSSKERQMVSGCLRVHPPSFQFYLRLYLMRMLVYIYIGSSRCSAKPQKGLSTSHRAMRISS